VSFLAVIDPNWKRERGGGKIKRGADRHYALESVDAIAAKYRASEPWRDVGPGLLWMWCTGSVILAGDAHAMARALGFRPCAEWVWVKDRIGTGQWCRKRHEHLWLCRRGKLKVPPTNARPDSVIEEKKSRHSAKPEAGWRVIETVSRAVLPGVVGVEWNARTRRAGWGAVGALDGEDRPIRYEQEGA
jgi:N6-adenosine-specific RNA methylase IME4